MKTEVRIEVLYKGKVKFTTSFIVQDLVDEYILADRAWDYALSYAETLCQAKWGRYADMNKLGDILKDIDYNYSVSEIA